MPVEIRKVLPAPHLFRENKQLGDYHAGNMHSAAGTIREQNNM